VLPLFYFFTPIDFDFIQFSILDLAVYLSKIVYIKSLVLSYIFKKKENNIKSIALLNWRPGYLESFKI
jgi:hypothetical protein